MSVKHCKDSYEGTTKSSRRDCKQYETILALIKKQGIAKTTEKNFNMESLENTYYRIGFTPEPVDGVIRALHETAEHEFPHVLLRL